jgi:hypothetical protein
MSKPVEVPSADAPRVDWARYFLYSAQKDVVFQEEQLVWDNEQIAYHQAHLLEYRKHRELTLVKLKAARAEVRRLTELVDGLEVPDA